MINKQNNRLDEIMIKSSNSKARTDIWEEIFNDLILESEPPVRYIKDAIIITRSGASYRVSPDDYVNIVARAKNAGIEHSDIHSCSLSIDFSKIKRDVNRWTNKFIIDIEGGIKEISSSILPVVKKSTPKKKISTPKKDSSSISPPVIKKVTPKKKLTTPKE